MAAARASANMTCREAKSRGTQVRAISNVDVGAGMGVGGGVGAAEEQPMLHATSTNPTRYPVFNNIFHSIQR
jgi:hypothetical protein